MDLIEWDLTDLHSTGVSPNLARRGLEDPFAEEVEVSFLVPEGTDRRIMLGVTAADVLGCSTRVNFSVRLASQLSAGHLAKSVNFS